MLLFGGEAEVVEMGSERAVISYACVSVDGVATSDAALAQVEIVSGSERVAGIFFVGLKVANEDA